jgi:hypothetical protein
MRSRCCLCVCLCIPLIIARQRLGKNPPVVVRQRFVKNVTAVTNTHATIEELLDASFSMWPVSYQGKSAIGSSHNFLFLHLLWNQRFPLARFTKHDVIKSQDALVFIYTTGRTSNVTRIELVHIIVQRENSVVTDLQICVP